MTIAVDSKIKATADMLDLGTPQALICIHCVLLWHYNSIHTFKYFNHSSPEVNDLYSPGPQKLLHCSSKTKITSCQLVATCTQSLEQSKARQNTHSTGVHNIQLFTALLCCWMSSWFKRLALHMCDWLIMQQLWYQQIGILKKQSYTLTQKYNVTHMCAQFKIFP